ncbi:MAG: DUF2292 domain-containing protein [Candidatus Omnitrophota bacterium]
MKTKERNHSIINDALIKDINEAVHKIDNGTITVRVREAKIIQIDIKDKKRFNEIWTLEQGGGI